MFDPRGDSRFDNFISTSSLVDLPMGAKRFTKMNNLGNKLSKIDGILVSQHVIDLWPGSHTVALPGEFSDHTPIFLSNMTTDFRPSPFKFYKSLLSHKDFPQLVKECWTSRNVSPVLIRGNIPLSFAKFTRLEYLHRSNNYLTGKIHFLFANITCLEYIDLSKNNFTGILPTQVVRLKNLDLSRNNFIGQTSILRWVHGDTNLLVLRSTSIDWITFPPATL
ncbi:cytochrome P450 [Tanacetum coccineum]